MEIVAAITQIATMITGVAAVLALLIKPIRLRLFGIADIRDGQKCLLRSDMLRMYYRHCESRTIRQYEYENFEYEYNAYKALGGNSFIDKIHAEVKTWEIES